VRLGLINLLQNAAMTHSQFVLEPQGNAETELKNPRKICWRRKQREGSNATVAPSNQPLLEHANCAKSHTVRVRTSQFRG
jgi:hypothetical protein